MLGGSYHSVVEHFVALLGDIFPIERFTCHFLENAHIHSCHALLFGFGAPELADYLGCRVNSMTGIDCLLAASARLELLAQTPTPALPS